MPTTERRRMQNRAAQRKFREKTAMKKQQVAVEEAERAQRELLKQQRHRPSEHARSKTNTRPTVQSRSSSFSPPAWSSPDPYSTYPVYSSSYLPSANTVAEPLPLHYNNSPFTMTDTALLSSFGESFDSTSTMDLHDSSLYQIGSHFPETNITSHELQDAMVSSPYAGFATLSISPWDPKDCMPTFSPMATVGLSYAPSSVASYDSSRDSTYSHMAEWFSDCQSQYSSNGGSMR